MQKNNLLGTFLKEKRQESNLSLREFDNAIGVARTYILSIENGSKAHPGDVMLKKLLMHFILIHKQQSYSMTWMLCAIKIMTVKIGIYQQIYLNIYRKPSL